MTEHPYTRETINRARQLASAADAFLAHLDSYPRQSCDDYDIAYQSIEDACSYIGAFVEDYG